MRTTWIAVSAIALLAGPLFASSAAERLDAAADTLDEIMAVRERGIPQDLLARSECIVLIPSAMKAGFVFGAEYGRGFFSCRTREHGWSAPGAIRTEGASFGLQIGGAETDIVMLVLNRQGANRLLRDKFTLGGDASVAAGPVGRDSQAATDAFMTAEILTYSRQRGIFAGLSLNGATLREDDSANREIYGHAIRNRDVIMNPTPIPPAAQRLIATLNKYSSRK
jgi:lipid-binding SYLF domain-containing protein